jgi:hypothetical protein
MDIRTGYGNHGDYIFGWKGDSLKTIVDTPCYVNCPGPKQTVAQMNKCAQKAVVNDEINGCKCLRDYLHNWHRVSSEANQLTQGITSMPGGRH